LCTKLIEVFQGDQGSLLIRICAYSTPNFQLKQRYSTYEAVIMLPVSLFQLTTIIEPTC